MNDASPLPPIHVEQYGLDHVRVTVPQTKRVQRYRRRVLLGRVIGMLAFASFPAAMVVMNWGDPIFDLCFGGLSIVFLSVAIYAICRPDQHMLFTDREMTIEHRDHILTITVPSIAKVREYPASEVVRFQSRRCDFSRCGMIVAILKRRRRVRGLVAVCANVEGAAEAVAALNQALHCTTT